MQHIYHLITHSFEVKNIIVTLIPAFLLYTIILQKLKQCPKHVSKIDDDDDDESMNSFQTLP